MIHITQGITADCNIHKFSKFIVHTFSWDEKEFGLSGIFEQTLHINGICKKYFWKYLSTVLWATELHSIKIMVEEYILYLKAFMMYLSYETNIQTDKYDTIAIHVNISI